MQKLQVQLQVQPDPAEVGRARRWARLRLSGCGIAADEPLAETLVLLVSELVTNAVVHARCPAVLRLTAPAGVPAVRVEVCDGSTAAPARPAEAPDERLDGTCGRGLDLVDVLSDRWGWQPDGDGKRVWCEIDRTESVRNETLRNGSEKASAPASALVG